MGSLTKSKRPFLNTKARFREPRVTCSFSLCTWRSSATLRSRLHSSACALLLDSFAAFAAVGAAEEAKRLVKASTPRKEQRRRKHQEVRHRLMPRESLRARESNFVKSRWVVHTLQS